MEMRIYRYGIIKVVATMGVIILLVFYVIPFSNNSLESSKKNNNTRCNRTEMYDMQPEFKRALSIIKQRFTDWYKRSKDAIDLSFFNCLDIQYHDVGLAEGMFSFDENVSSVDRLIIYVNPSYKESDDLLTAFLLTHETTHAGNYLDRVLKGKNISCLDDEVGSFYNQLLLSGLLTKEESNSLNARLLKDYYKNPSNQLHLVGDLLLLENEAQKICKTNQFNNCAMKEVVPLINEWVRTNPFYIKQCDL